jgi:hypothetical protein
VVRRGHGRGIMSVKNSALSSEVVKMTKHE